MSGSFDDGPLTGIRVLDLTTVVMGPFATRILADLGADVIKVETPEGDLMRHYKPYRNPGMSGQNLHINRNKRSLMLDLKRPAAARALKRLIPQCDVLVHNIRPQAIRRLGFDYPQIRDLNPQLIYCAAHGFGDGGPYQDKAAYDDLIQAASGLAELSARVRPPTCPPPSSTR